MKKLTPFENRLLRYLRGNRVHPVILLTGGRPDQRLETAKQVAQFLLCANPKEGFSCGECSACRRIVTGLHPDVLVLEEPEEKHLKIESIREVCHQMQIQPIEAKRKVCIVHECHRLNAASSNAFLKTLEEPGPERYFLLLTDQMGMIIPTILSRSIRFHRSPTDADNSNADFSNAEALWNEFEKTKDIGQLVAGAEDREKTKQLVLFLQSQLHRAQANQPFSPEAEHTTLAFEELLQLEGRLQSNANYGLMLESVVRRYFL